MCLTVFTMPNKGICFKRIEISDSVTKNKYLIPNNQAQIHWLKMHISHEKCFVSEGVRIPHSHSFKLLPTIPSRISQLYRWSHIAASDTDRLHIY